jgi:hypothetical protein
VYEQAAGGVGPAGVKVYVPPSQVPPQLSALSVVTSGAGPSESATVACTCTPCPRWRRSAPWCRRRAGWSQEPGSPAPVKQLPLAHEAFPVAPGGVWLQGYPLSTRHAASQPSPPAVPPSSQPSPASRMPLPHRRVQTPGSPEVRSQ